MQYLGDYAIGQKITFAFSTSDSGGQAVDPTVDGTIRVYKGNGAVERTAGITYTVGFDTKTGVHLVEIVATDAFYVPFEDYFIVLDTATIDTVTPVTVVLAHFSIENRDNGDTITGSVTNVPAGGGSFIDTALTLTGDDDILNSVCVFLDGVNKGIPRKVTGYTQASDTVAFANPFPNTIESGAYYRFIGLIE